MVISFNSLQTGKSFRTQARTSKKEKENESFNSLQTGKSFRTGDQEPRVDSAVLRFNSLQTGKSFRTKFLRRQSGEEDFARSFNSLQTGKSFRTKVPTTPAKVSALFQFPSNGKVLSDELTTYHVKQNDNVSIPFKRESPFGRTFRGTIEKDAIFVSIPFKRESPFGLCLLMG